jgi:transcriptional regulator with GAF, ATPase, and Fis domain
MLLVNCASGVYLVPLGAKRDVVLGRDPTCDVIVTDGSVSRRHARLTLGKETLLEDLGSKNGTTVNGSRLAVGRGVAIAHGKEFKLGTASLVLQGAQSHKSPPPPSPDETPSETEGVIVEDPATKNAYALLDVFAPSPLCVLILGETGVGKELYAEAVHRRSTRAGHPFLQINCAALPESLLEAELFGYEKGAFTGASQAKPGLFEVANGGSVFLDEIGEVSLVTQAKLLRVLENGQFMRLGSVKPRTTDVRIIAATNRDLQQLVLQGRFRADLFYRINGVSVTLPALRARIGDIAPLSHHFLRRAARASGKAAPMLTANAIAALERYEWPGNVRELRNVIERTSLLCADTLDVEHLRRAVPEAFARQPSRAPARMASSPPAAAVTVPTSDMGGNLAALRDEWKTQEAQKIVDALTAAAWNQGAAAKALGISRHTLIRRMEEYGLARPRKGR